MGTASEADRCFGLNLKNRLVGDPALLTEWSGRMTNAEPRKASVDSRWLRNLASDCLNLPIHEIDPRVPLVRYGLDSLAAAELTGAIAEGLGREVPDSLLLVHQDINSIEHYIKSNQFSAELVTARIDDSLSTTRQMLADSILPDDVRPELAKQAPNAPRSILVTGATGFLGAYILNTCLRKTAVRAYCLVRPEERVDIRDRIRQNLEFYGIWDSTFESRIHPVPGDLLRPALGLAEDEFEALCRNIDEIYHCAAVVNWVFPYGGLRDVNVLGTLELLRLACKYKQKPFHFVSTMAVCYSTSGPEEVTERDNVFSRLDGIHLGYAQSKCVAEALVQAANERGLPATIYRPSLISGDSRSGVSQTGDLLSILIKGCIEMGSAPDLDWALDCGPVDYVAEAIVGLSRMRYDPARVFHLANPKGNSGFVVGERGFGPATALDTVDAPILKPSAFGRGWDLGACVNGGVEGRAGDAPLPPKWLITMGLRQKNRFNECKACGCEPASNHMSGFGFSATDSDSGRRAHGSHERARSARKGRKKHVSVLPRPNRSPWIVVEQNHNGIGKLMVPAFQIYANMNVINDL